MAREPKPWWPDLRLPEAEARSMPDGSSGSILINATNNTPTIFNSGDVVGAGTYVCGVDYAKPTPCVLTIGTSIVSGAKPGVQGVQSVCLPAGQSAYDAGGHSSNMSMGFVEVTYGVGAGLQRLVMDMRPGTYQLPPSTQVRVSALGYYYTANGGFKQPLNFNAAIAPGYVGKGSDPTFGQFVGLLAATAVATIQVPDKARWVDCWALNVVALGAGKPVLSLYSDQETGFPSLVRDYTSGIWAPPYEARCFGGTQSLTATIISTVACDAWIQFGLEF